MGHLYRKRVVELEAVQWQAKHPEDAPAWFQRAIDERVLMARDDGRLVVKTLEGDLACQPGGWVVRGIKGELYPVEAAIFAELYEKVEDGQSA